MCPSAAFPRARLRGHTKAPETRHGLRHRPSADEGPNYRRRCAQDYAGAAITGSALNVYSREPAVERQIELARAVFAAGVPCFGSCWGLQVGVTAAAAWCAIHADGVRFCRRITLTHQTATAMFAGKPEVFEACRTRRTVEPAGDSTRSRTTTWDCRPRNQAQGGGTFWGALPRNTVARNRSDGTPLWRMLIRDGLVKDQAGSCAVRGPDRAARNRTTRGWRGASAWACRSQILPSSWPSCVTGWSSKSSNR
jgi:hypothetical protein